MQRTPSANWMAIADGYSPASLLPFACRKQEHDPCVVLKGRHMSLDQSYHAVGCQSP